MITTVRYCDTFKMSMRSMGSSRCSWRYAYAPISARPATISPTVTRWFSAELNDDRPYNKLTRPHVESATESASNFVRRNSPNGFSSHTASSTITAVSPVTMPKMARQPTVSTSTPESDGPMVGANPMISPTMPMADPRFSRGIISSTMLNTIGMTNPVAAACMMRPASSTGNIGASAATKLPHPNSVKPPINRRRVEKRPIRYAASGMTTASVSA